MKKCSSIFIDRCCILNGVHYRYGQMCPCIQSKSSEQITKMKGKCKHCGDKGYFPMGCYWCGRAKPKPKKKIKKVKPSDFKSGITVDLYRIGYHDGMEDGFRLGQLLNKKVK